jgi:single-strand DNA-binding protein
MSFIQKTSIMQQNSVQLVGYVGVDPLISISTNGTKKARIRVATHHLMKKNDGDKKEYGTTWHDIVAWDETAAYAERSFVKRSHILIYGKLLYRTYTDKKGEVRSVAEIRASSLVNLDR